MHRLFFIFIFLLPLTVQAGNYAFEEGFNYNYLHASSTDQPVHGSEIDLTLSKDRSGERFLIFKIYFEIFGMEFNSPVKFNPATKQISSSGTVHIDSSSVFHEPRCTEAQLNSEKCEDFRYEFEAEFQSRSKIKITKLKLQGEFATFNSFLENSIFTVQDFETEYQVTALQSEKLKMLERLLSKGLAGLKKPAQIIRSSKLERQFFYAQLDNKPEYFDPESWLEDKRVPTHDEYVQTNWLTNFMGLCGIAGPGTYCAPDSHFLWSFARAAEVTVGWFHLFDADLRHPRETYGQDYYFWDHKAGEALVVRVNEPLN